MKIKNHSRPAALLASQISSRFAGGKPLSTKSFEHRYERRKIQERLRRLDWALNIED